MSTPNDRHAPRAPKRARGRKRVSELVEAGVALFAEKGYDAATMTEVAARAAAPIGSLYQFFPSKEALADAVLERCDAQLDAALAAIENIAAAAAIPPLVDAFLNLLLGFERERAAMATLIESRAEASTRAAELKRSRRARVAQILARRFPGLPPERTRNIAHLLIQLIKIAANVAAEPDPETRAGVRNELRTLGILYLQDAERASELG